MEKNVIVYVEDGLWWDSCLAISSNLKSAYQKTNMDISWVPISIQAFNEAQNHPRAYLKAWCEKVWELKPQRIIFVDFHPHQGFLASELFRHSMASPETEIVFHIYGDFTLLASQWFAVGLKLKGKRLRFVCASHRQSEFIGNFLKNSSVSVCLCPFPVDTSFFHFDQALRKYARQELQVRDHEKILLYTGRISSQKNVTAIVQEFPRLLSQNRNLKKLIIAGGFDDLGARLLGLPTTLGWSYSKMQTELSQLPMKIRSQIEFTGHVDRKQIRKLIHGADLFSSLSLYHDEDFGMSAAEALSCGLPAVLTDWGGYSSFAIPEVPCHLVPLELAGNGYQLDFDSYRTQVSRVFGSRPKDADRIKWAQDFAQSFSIPSIAKRLEALNSKPSVAFQGFNSKLKMLAKLTFNNLLPSNQTFYGEAYKAYYRSREIQQ